MGNGTEILGLGYQIQRTGARAAIASLWQVDDGGTQQLMTEFYHNLHTPGTSKVEALRRAQITLIQGELSASGQERGQFTFVSSDRNPVSPPQAQSLSHPYYWAPFILIGNGL